MAYESWCPKLGDARVPVTDLKEIPHSGVGHLVIYKSGKQSNASGFLVKIDNKYIILTAAHNIYDRKNGKADEVAIHLGRHHELYPYGVILKKAHNIEVPSEYIKGENDYDFGIILLAMKDYDYEKLHVFSLSSTINDHGLTDAYMNGYPGVLEGNCVTQKKIKLTKPKIIKKSIVYGDATSSGNSGSPIYVVTGEIPVAVGIHVEGFREQNTHNRAILISEEVISHIKRLLDKNHLQQHFHDETRGAIARRRPQHRKTYHGDEIQIHLQVYHRSHSDLMIKTSDFSSQNVLVVKEDPLHQESQGAFSATDEETNLSIIVDRTSGQNSETKYSAFCQENSFRENSSVSFYNTASRQGDIDAISGEYPSGPMQTGLLGPLSDEGHLDVKDRGQYVYPRKRSEHLDGSLGESCIDHELLSFRSNLLFSPKVKQSPGTFSVLEELISKDLLKILPNFFAPESSIRSKFVSTLNQLSSSGTVLISPSLRELMHISFKEDQPEDILFETFGVVLGLPPFVLTVTKKLDQDRTIEAYTKHLTQDVLRTIRMFTDETISAIQGIILPDAFQRPCTFERVLQSVRGNSGRFCNPRSLDLDVDKCYDISKSCLIAMSVTETIHKSHETIELALGSKDDLFHRFENMNKKWKWRMDERISGEPGSMYSEAFSECKSSKHT